jgi:hypothetical protein
MGLWDENTGQMHAGLLHSTGRLKARIEGKKVAADMPAQESNTTAYTQAADHYAHSIEMAIKTLQARTVITQTSPSGKAYWLAMAEEVERGIALAKSSVERLMAPGRSIQPADLHELGGTLEHLTRLIERNMPEASDKASEISMLVSENYDVVKQTRKALFLDGYAERSFAGYVNPRKVSK